MSDQQRKPLLYLTVQDLDKGEHLARHVCEFLAGFYVLNAGGRYECNGFSCGNADSGDVAQAAAALVHTLAEQAPDPFAFQEAFFVALNAMDANAGAGV